MSTCPSKDILCHVWPYCLLHACLQIYDKPSRHFLSGAYVSMHGLTLKVLNFWKFSSYRSLKPLWSGMGEVVPARTSPTLHPPSPPTVHQLSRLALWELTYSLCQGFTPEGCSLRETEDFFAGLCFLCAVTLSIKVSTIGLWHNLNHIGIITHSYDAHLESSRCSWLVILCS